MSRLTQKTQNVYTHGLKTKIRFSTMYLQANIIINCSLHAIKNFSNTSNAN